MTDSTVGSPFVAINLTPHSITYYKRNPDQPGNPTILATFPSKGSLRLISAPSVERKMLHLLNGDSPDAICCSMPPSPTYEGLDTTTEGYTIFTNFQGTNAVFIVSMLVGQYLAEHRELIPSGCHVCGPDTGPVNAYRDAKQNIIGTFELVHYAESV